MIFKIVVCGGGKSLTDALGGDVGADALDKRSDISVREKQTVDLLRDVFPEKGKAAHKPHSPFIIRHVRAVQEKDRRNRVIRKFRRTHTRRSRFSVRKQARICVLPRLSAQHKMRCKLFQPHILGKIAKMLPPCGKFSARIGKHLSVCRAAERIIGNRKPLSGIRSSPVSEA